MKQIITIGRNPDNDIVVDGSFDTVSGHHATISQTDTGYRFEDHSTNGSYINEQRVHNTTVVIKHGDNIRLSTAYSLTWRQIDALLATDRATQPRDNRATQYQPQGAASYERESTGYEQAENAERNNARQAENNYKQPEAVRTEEPKYLVKFNWGAFMLPGLWGLFNGHWWLLLVNGGLNVLAENEDFAIIAMLAQIVVMFLFGFCGNKWAWKKATDISATDFDRKQQNWSIWGGIIGLIVNIGGFMVGLNS